MKRSRISRTAKKDTLSYWKAKLWKEFSRFIRARDKNVCFTCGGNGNQAGHMIPRASGGLSLYFHEQNVHAQCYRCNINLGGNGAIYAVNFVKKYGQEDFDEILRLQHQGFRKYTIPEYQELIEEYKIKTEKLDD